MPEICENCRRAIGDLEAACVFQEHVVCSDCKAILDSNTSSIGYTPISVSTASMKPVVIEKTAKSIKKIIGFGVAIMAATLLIACVVLVIQPTRGPTSMQWLVLIQCGLFFLVGFGVFVYGRISAWWHHE